MRRFKFRGSASQELEQSSQTEAKRRAMSAILFLAFVFLLVSPLGARAGMIGAYDPSLWTLTNTSADGFVTPIATGVEITGGNTGSGNPGTTDFQIVAVGTGLVSFSFVYFSLDSPTFDYAGYLLGPNFFPLADSSGISGSQSFAVTLGENFGFRVGTVDNQYEPGVLDISDFNAPVSTVSTGAPEPATGAIVLAALAFVLGIRLRQRRSHQDLTSANRSAILSMAMIGLGLLGASSLSAQIHFNGSPVTGQLVLINQVNVSQQALQGLQSQQSGVSGLTATRVLGPEVKPNIPLRLLQPPAKLSLSATSVQTAGLSASPVMQPMTISTSTSAFSFNGIDHYDQRFANHGNQFSVEPPSQGLAVANGYILEAVNNAIQVYNLSGVPQLATVIVHEPAIWPGAGD